MDWPTVTMRCYGSWRRRTRRSVLVPVGLRGRNRSLRGKPTTTVSQMLTHPGSIFNSGPWVVEKPHKRHHKNNFPDREKGNGYEYEMQCDTL